MSNNIPSFNYEEAVKESPREAARWHFERKPYEITGISVQEYMRRIKKRGGAGEQEKTKTIPSCFERDS